ncbi:MAG: heparan-alpha-glucosaminide N-acetyltransferase [Burkholderiales bacterium]
MTAAPVARAPGTAAAAGRIAGIDALRGLAVIAMVAFHFCFDLAHFGVIAANFYRDAFWLHARTAILSSFLLLAGVSLVLAQRTAQGRAGFWRHVATIAACALLVTAATFVAFPQSYVTFGVLHAIALCLVLLRPLVARPWLALALGVAVIAAGNAFTATAFDGPPWGFVGFATVKPRTEDYVPLFPWAGVMLAGIALGHALLRHDFRAVAPFGILPRFVRWLGRHSLLVYMLHQPLLFGALWLAVGR